MENRYYTPEIEEFHVGFEYEHKDNGVWKQREIDRPNQISAIDMNLRTPYMDGTPIRVKYLDREDILDCGFKKINEGIFKMHESNFGMYFIPSDNNRVEIYIDIYDYEGCVFIGHIKNKNELKTLLKQLRKY